MLFNSRWIQKNIIYISDIVSENGYPDLNKILLVITDNQAITKFEFNSIKNAMSYIAGRKINTVKDKTLYFNGKVLSKLSSRDFRLYFQKQSIEPKETHWVSVFGNQANEKCIWSRIPLLVKETKLIVLQWKILHNIFPDNSLLYKMKIKDILLCIQLK